MGNHRSKWENNGCMDMNDGGSAWAKVLKALPQFWMELTWQEAWNEICTGTMAQVRCARVEPVGSGKGKHTSHGQVFARKGV